MRSLVAEIFHSPSSEQLLLSSANSSSCGPNTMRIGASVGCRQLDAALGARRWRPASSARHRSASGRAVGLPSPARALTARLPNIGSPSMPCSIAR